MIKVLFICHGNICRSPMCQSVLQDMVERRGIADGFLIDSRATSREEVGNPPHYGAVRKLQAAGISMQPHRARQITWEDYCSFDYIIGMDDRNIRNLKRILKDDPDGKINKLLSFAGTTRDIADPWYTDDFDATYRDVTEGCEAFLRYLDRKDRI